MRGCAKVASQLSAEGKGNHRSQISGTLNRVLMYKSI